MTPTEKLQQEAEQLYPYPESSEAWWLAIIDVKRAAHVACAEKYTAIIEGHIEACNVLAKACEEKDKEIERLRRFVFDVRDWPVPMDYRGIAKMQEAAFDLLNTKTPTP